MSYVSISMGDRLSFRPSMGYIQHRNCLFHHNFINSSALLMCLMAFKLKHVDHKLFGLAVTFQRIKLLNTAKRKEKIEVIKKYNNLIPTFQLHTEINKEVYVGLVCFQCFSTTK